MAKELLWDIEADPTVDVVVATPDGAPQRLTIHTGRVEFYQSNAGMWRYDGGGHRAEESLWLPDGLGYLSPPTVVSASVALSQHMAGSDVQMQLGLAGWSARAEPDPRDTGLWFVQLWLDVYVATRPALFSYVVHVMAPVADVEPER